MNMYNLLHMHYMYYIYFDRGTFRGDFLEHVLEG